MLADYKCEDCDAILRDITEIIRHECDPVPLDATGLTPNQRSTLMYVESRVVDHAGKLDPAQMNYEDQQNLKVFKAAGLLEVGGLQADPENPRVGVQTVEVFTDEAWDLAGDCRQLRAYEDDRVDFPVGVDG